MGKEEMLGRIKKEVLKVYSERLEFGELSFEDKLLNNQFLEVSR